MGMVGERQEEAVKQLFEESKIGNLLIKNRFVRSATWENMATDKGHMTQALYDIYEELAMSEVGLIITGYANVVEEEKPNAGMMGIYEDSFIEEYKKLTNIVHKYNSKIVMQLAYGGTKTTYQVGERVIYAPSNVPEKSTNVLGKEMTKQEIIYITNAFANAAYRAKQAGFDGIEIHGAHSYLINQFLSPYYNKREDEYGGSLENRMRFLVEIYESIREKVGNDFAVLVKLTCTEFFEGGLTFEETRKICKKMEQLGVDALEITGNIHAKAKQMVGQAFDGYQIQEEGYFYQYANIISQEVQIPICTVGGFKDLSVMEKMREESNIAYFGISRPFLAEPKLIQRWKEEDTKEAICIHCSKCRTPNGNYCVVIQNK